MIHKNQNIAYDEKLLKEHCSFRTRVET